jgi:hypothetical protein
MKIKTGSVIVVVGIGAVLGLSRLGGTSDASQPTPQPAAGAVGALSTPALAHVPDIVKRVAPEFSQADTGNVDQSSAHLLAHALGVEGVDIYLTRTAKDGVCYYITSSVEPGGCTDDLSAAPTSGLSVYSGKDTPPTIAGVVENRVTAGKVTVSGSVQPALVRGNAFFFQAAPGTKLDDITAITLEYGPGSSITKTIPPSPSP